MDISTSMLSLLNARLKEEPAEVRDRVSVVQADACELDLGEKFDLVMVPYYTFNYFLTEVDQKRALERIRAHMSDSAYALLDVYIPWNRLEYCPPEPIFRNEVVDPRNGNRIRSWNIFSLDKEIQADYQSKRFEITAPDGSVTSKEFMIQRRYTLPDQLEKLFADNGFAIEGVYGGYGKEAPKAKSEQMMYVLRKA
ncbi:MAG: methyltransferase domain-containing protein [Chloroflexi bacterium]|nr:methyltransferase domain-containing protein [Chloroflexota bacterium]